MSDSTTDSSTTSAAADVNPKRTKNKQPLRTVPAGCTCFRLLCHASRIGGVIGKSGHVIKQFQRETSAKIRVEVPIPNSDDRIITVIGNSSVNKTLSLSNNNDNNNCDGASECSHEVSAAQEALIRVFERILAVAAEANGGDLASGGVVSCRLLVDKSVIGAVIGKKGKVIEKIRKDTRCKIRVLVEDKMPSCALATDEMVQIEGDILAIKKALLAVTRCLQERSYTVLGGPHHAVPQENITNGYMDIPSVSSDGDTCPPQQEIVFRMLCSSDRVGIVIGKSGTIIQALENESGASISFSGPVSGCDERVITITSKETLESQNLAAQNAVILVFNRIETSSSGVMASARLLISRNQMGCLLGKGGSIIADMRKVTGAVIKIVGDQLPKCALETDQVVLITGEFVNVRDALYSVTGRLRTHFFSSKMLKSHGMRGPHANLPRSMEGLKLSSSIEHPAKPHSRIRKGNKASTSVRAGHELISSGGRSAIVTSMSVEIAVPQNVIGRVYGENEGNLTRLRQISGAKVVVHEPQSGTTDHVVVISGTPDETQSAQSLLQAFILSDQS